MTSLSESSHPDLDPTWYEQGSVYQPRSAAFVLLVAISALGALQFGSYFNASLEAVPQAALFSLILLVLYCAPFYFVITAGDLFEREPFGLMLCAFSWGALAATFVAGVANTPLLDITSRVVSPSFAETWGAAIVAPSTEEPMKAVAVLLLCILAASEIDTPTDGLVLGALAGLGFQVVENYGYFIDVASQAPEAQVEAVVWMFGLRGILGGLWTHALWTGLVGYGIGYAVSRSDVAAARRGAVVAGLFAAAWSLHFLWNSPLLTGDMGVVALAAKGLPGLLLLAAIYELGRRREALWIQHALEPELEAGIVTEDELQALLSLPGRRRAGHIEKMQSGRSGARLVRRLQKAEIALALARSRRMVSPAEIERARADVVRVRAELDHLREAAVRAAPARDTR